MRQILFEIPIPFVDKSLPIYGFGMMLFLAFLASSWLGRRLATREKIDPDRITDLALWIFLGGIVGARLLFMVRNPDQFHSVLDFFKIWQGGIVFYGGVIAAIAVFLWYTRRHKLPAWQVLDVLAPAIALGIGVGRFGCLLNGCCWGEPSDLPWAITFPAGSIPWDSHVQQRWIDADAPSSLPLHPTQIYLAMEGWALLALTLAYYAQRRRPGEVMALLMVGYSLTRFFTEFLRGDEPLVDPLPLTLSQLISIVLFTGGLFMWTWLRYQPALPSAGTVAR
jgi:phosphatidylglycerol:prolipoprotein diacylglycerol transferase